MQEVKENEVLEIGFIKPEQKVIFIWKRKLVTLLIRINTSERQVEIWNERDLILAAKTESREKIEVVVMKAVEAYIKKNKDEARPVKGIHLFEQLLMKASAQISENKRLLVFEVPHYLEKTVLYKSSEDVWRKELVNEDVHNGAGWDRIDIVVRNYILTHMKKEMEEQARMKVSRSTSSASSASSSSSTVVVKSETRPFSLSNTGIQLKISVKCLTETLTVTLMNAGEGIRFKAAHKDIDLVGILERDIAHSSERWYSLNYPEIRCLSAASYEETISEILERVVLLKTLHCETPSMVKILFDTSLIEPILPSDEFHFIQGFEHNGNCFYLLRERERYKIYKEHPQDEFWRCGELADSNPKLLAHKVVCSRTR